jgi:AcrR family transcriptional regulator
MPRITAPTVAEHAARQEAAVVRAAAELFAERGVSDVSLGDVAARAGLARNSIYRYFPDRAHLLAAWFRRELGPLLDASTAIAERSASPRTRLDAWLDLHLDYLTAPEHRSMVSVAAALGTLPDAVRAELGAGHAALYETLRRILVDQFRASGSRRDETVLVALLGGMLRAAAELVAAGAPAADVARELRRAARASAGIT